MKRSPLSEAALAALTERSDTKGLVRLALHAAVIAGAGAVYAAAFETLWMLPAAWAYGTCLAFLFAPLHETVHCTAFRSRRINRAVSAACGWILVLPPRFFRAFHLEHHRCTQDPKRDPELAVAPLRKWRQYAWRVSGAQYWVRQIRVISRFAAGRVTEPYIARGERDRIVREARTFLASYVVVGALSAVTGSTLLLWFWVVPILLGQPMPRLYLIAEHTGCPMAPNMLENSRTVHTNALVRFLAWNMPYHPEHTHMPGSPFTHSRAPTPCSPRTSGTSRADMRGSIGTSPEVSDSPGPRPPRRPRPATLPRPTATVRAFDPRPPCRPGADPVVDRTTPPPVVTTAGPAETAA